MPEPLTLAEALEWLDCHVNREAIDAAARDALWKPPPPTLERMRELMGLMGEPQHLQPIIHVTGTNGKTSTSRLIINLLAGRGLSIGGYSSPHLERLNERITRNLEPIPDDDLADVLTGLATLEPYLDANRTPTYFEVMTAAAFRWFADVAVDVAVIEVGVGGTWDATCVADGEVGVITNIDIDHVEYLGTTRESIARDKAGIARPGATLVVGERDPDLAPIFAAAGAGEVWMVGEEFACEENIQALGGRSLTLRTPGATYSEVYLPLLGAHQGDNAACALAAAEAFFGGPLDPEVVHEAFGAATSPGRLEVVGRRPLVVLDGAHNPAGMAALSSAVEEELGLARARVYVVGMFRGKDPVEMLEALDAPAAALVVCVPPPWPRALPAEDVAAAARQLGCQTAVASTVGEALALAFDAAS
ncbi:MAG TPA: Mur ligase family protein, partial [Acidimicrobiales bacterium]|nr:Mur ligase family protein [Acidimicrobiales bacterium]